MTYVLIPEKDLKAMKLALEKLARVSDAERYINEVQVCELLGICKRTLWNYISTGKIPANYYKIGVGGNRFYNKEKLMGI